jgi:hypothetical protein
MLLIHILKILFCVLIIRHSIRWVSYHIHHRNNKARVFHGNTRMPMDVELALMYGIYAKTKNRFKFKDLSYRKSLAEWKQLLNTWYPPDNLNSAHQSNPSSGLVNGNQEQFPQIKNKNPNSIKITNPSHPNPVPLLFLGGDKAYAGSRGGQCFTIHKISGVNNKSEKFKILKISQNPIPFSK